MSTGTRKRKKPWAGRANGPGFVYVVYSPGTGWYKVGHTVDPRRRLGELRRPGHTKFPDGVTGHTLVLAHLEEADARYDRECEVAAELAEWLRSRKGPGEWWKREGEDWWLHMLDGLRQQDRARAAVEAWIGGQS